MWRRIREILIKEFRQTLREPRMRALLFGPPIIQLLIFGYAVNLDVDNSRIAWMDQDRSSQSRELRAAFEASALVRGDGHPGERRRGAGPDGPRPGAAVVRVLPGFSRHIAARRERRRCRFWSTAPTPTPPPWSRPRQPG